MEFNTIFNKSSEDMSELRDGCAHLVVTSPPYNVGMEYEEVLEVEEWRSLMRRVWQECFRVLCDGGRLCVNIAGVNRQPYIPLQSYTTVDLLEIGFQMRGDIIWNKDASSNGWSTTAWGSWRSPRNPHLRDLHEYILVFSKGSFHRDGGKGYTISDQEFMDNSLSVWTMRTAEAAKIGHPAPFPVTLPYRLIKFYTFENDVVLDPFMGSGTTALAAQQLKRRWVGYELSEEYIKLAEGRLLQRYLF